METLGNLIGRFYSLIRNFVGYNVPRFRAAGWWLESLWRGVGVQVAADGHRGDVTSRTIAQRFDAKMNYFAKQSAMSWHDVYANVSS
jgi:hypothetical protein